MKRILLAALCCIMLSVNCNAALAKPLTPSNKQNISDAVSEQASLSTGGSGKALLDDSDTPQEPTKVKILAVGDLMCLYAQLAAAKKNGQYQFDYCFGQIKDKVSAADLAVGNLETLVASGYPYTQHNQKGNPKINAPESYLAAIKNCGFDALTDANNHIYDRKTDGIDKTIKQLDNYGFEHTGAYATGETRAPLIVNVKGINIAILAYTDHLNNHPKNVTAVDLYKPDKVTADIKAAKDAGADFVMVYMHWGTERTHKVNKAQKTMAAFIANAGADIIIGSHPHCTQGTQLIQTDNGSVPVFYSLGNYLSSMGATICKDSMMVNITLQKDADGKTTIAALTYTPTYCTNTSAGRFVILPADLASIAANNSKALKSSRTRTVKVVGDKVAAPE